MLAVQYLLVDIGVDVVKNNWKIKVEYIYMLKYNVMGIKNNLTYNEKLLINWNIDKIKFQCREM